ncbi:DsbA family oxidoreductase [Streptomyces botrytidirepellens]|uniref:DsbA family oxidoreductase n=1 Tax=Streptomyces botrytidirepellens TaxID=2486417 RepID=A0A3M8WF89_9ACTN|nr:DsbA family oxidoreductase [Streptomyces botrytidirepellens]RNG28227.1 DsbA family oxidoreductase [Streptomyces botrytidirepellens]
MSAPERPEGRLVVDVWSDIMCPFCYIGDTLLAQALERFPHGSDVEVRYHSFQLMPHLPTDHAVDLNELLSKERGFPKAQAEAMNAQVAARAAQIGLDFRLDSVIATNTRAAHRLIHFAESQGRQHDMVQRLFRAYFTDGLNVGDHDVLAGLAAEIGLDRSAVHEALDSGAFDADVDADVRQAGQLGIGGVPFFVFDGQYAVSGAQPVEAFLRALDVAWKGKFTKSA